MQNTQTKTITISDIVQWYIKGEIELSPRYQRNTVWNDDAKSYLMDTIIRGLPIPPIFLRQKINLSTKTTLKEIVDGQQRIRTIIDFVSNENFTIKRNHNSEYSGLFFSELDEDTQRDILGYSILANVITETDDAVIYDMFARLNSNNYVLNRQEIRNSKYWGLFKVLSYKLAAEYRSFFMDVKIFNDKDCSRMRDVELINSLLIVLLEGVVDENSLYVDRIYSKYDKNFSNFDEIFKKFNRVMKIAIEMYNYLDCKSYFKNKNYFYTLFSVICNQLFGLKNCDAPRYTEFSNDNFNFNLFVDKFLKFDRNVSIALESSKGSSIDFSLFDYISFDSYNRKRTTSKESRIKRIMFLNAMIAQ